jgi:GDP-L-fucose synthase
MSIADQRILVAGARGMVGSAVVRALRARGAHHLLTPTSKELDLRNQAAVNAWFADHKPGVVIFAAAKVGGILANNTYPADFIYDNLAMATNAIQAAFVTGTERFLFLGSSCIYPREAPQPMPEDCLLTSPLEKTNEAYALAKIAGLKMCEFYRRQHGVLFHSAMPTNLYGPGDNYHPTQSHVLPGLLRRFHEAREAGLPEVVCWGSGSPLREFLHSDDLAAALLYLLELDNPPDWVNVGSGEEVSIRELAELIRSTVGYEGEIKWDSTKPDGTPRKLMDSSRLRSLGWTPHYTLSTGIPHAYEDFKANALPR